MPTQSGGAPERGAEAGESGAAGERAQYAEEQSHVQQMRHQDDGEVGGRVQPEQLPGTQKEEVANEEVVAAERGEEKRQDAVALDARQLREVIGEEVDSRDGVVEPRAQRERHENQRMPSAGLAGAFTADGSEAEHEGSDASVVWQGVKRSKTSDMGLAAARDRPDASRTRVCLAFHHRSTYFRVPFPAPGGVGNRVA